MTKENNLWEVRYSERAKEDLKGIVDYIVHVLLEPGIAANIHASITKAVRSLEKLPYRFHSYLEEPFFSLGMRVMKVKNYLIFYIPNEADHTVHVVRMMYAGRDVRNQLN